ncbi:MAG: Uncharacterised protein [Cryomorphaceae bacterium]|nr:MAG: Uncharacterised protein [Cryomorphaceae bacterium]
MNFPNMMVTTISGGMVAMINKVNLIEVNAKITIPPITIDNPLRNSAKVVVSVSPICEVSEATREFNSPTRFAEKNCMGKCTK